MKQKTHSRDRDILLAKHASNVAYMRDQVQADGHFRVDLLFDGQSTSVYNKDSLERQWHRVMRPLCAAATRIRLFGRPEGVRFRLAASDRWHEFIRDGGQLLSEFTTFKPDGREEFEVIKDRLLSEAGTEFWMWCMLAVEKAALRPIILLANSDSLGSTFFEGTTDPVVVKGYEDVMSKAAVQFATNHARSGGLAVVCAHARDTHELSLFADSGAITSLYDDALSKATFSSIFAAVLAAPIDN
jgi:hypothetical protein